MCMIPHYPNMCVCFVDCTQMNATNEWQWDVFWNMTIQCEISLGLPEVNIAMGKILVNSVKSRVLWHFSGFFRNVTNFINVLLDLWSKNSWKFEICPLLFTTIRPNIFSKFKWIKYELSYHDATLDQGEFELLVTTDVKHIVLNSDIYFIQRVTK